MGSGQQYRQENPETDDKKAKGRGRGGDRPGAALLQRGIAGILEKPAPIAAFEGQEHVCRHEAEQEVADQGGKVRGGRLRRSLSQHPTTTRPPVLLVRPPAPWPGGPTGEGGL